MCEKSYSKTVVNLLSVDNVGWGGAWCAGNTHTSRLSSKMIKFLYSHTLIIILSVAIIYIEDSMPRILAYIGFNEFWLGGGGVRRWQQYSRDMTHMSHFI